MQCPNCGQTNNSVVLDSRPLRHTVRRRRKCLSCDERFSTYEYVRLKLTKTKMVDFIRDLETIKAKTDRVISGISTNLKNAVRVHDR
jgi:transcriptional regulator NrdR family protein